MTINNDFKEKEMKYCVLYIRVSTDQESQDGSYEEQYDELERYAKERGFVVLRVYKERITATKVEGRGEFDELMNDIPLKKFDAIIFKDLSRSARNIEIAARLKRICLENEIGIYSSTEGDHMELDVLGYDFKAMMNQHYSVDMSMKIKSRFKSRMKKGEWLKGEGPYGYYVKDNKLYIREDETTAIVKRIYGEYLAGHGVDSIAKRLTRDGVITPSLLKGKKNAGVNWHGTTIKQILTNRAYCGDLVQGKEETASAISKKRIKNKNAIVVENTHELIISKGMFFEVQQLMESRKSGPRATPVKHMFTDILICGKCGKKYWYRSAGERYICGSYARYGKIACDANAVKEIDIKKIVIEELNDLVKQYHLDEKIDTELESKISSKLYSISSKKKILLNKLNLFEDSKATLLISKITNEITVKEYEVTINVLKKKIDKVQMELNRLENANMNIDKLKVQKRIKEIFYGAENFDELNREMLFRFIEKIIVHGKNDYEIVYRFKL